MAQPKAKAKRPVEKRKGKSVGMLMQPMPGMPEPMQRMMQR